PGLVVRRVVFDPGDPLTITWGGSLPALFPGPLVLLLADDGLCRGEAGDGDSERGAADVVEADPVAELDRPRVAAVLPADAALEVLAGAPALLHGDLDQLTDAARVQR